MRSQPSRIVQVKLESQNKKRIHVARESVLALGASRSMPLVTGIRLRPGFFRPQRTGRSRCTMLC
jgi:hypothetical protein